MKKLVLLSTLFVVAACTNEHGGEEPSALTIVRPPYLEYINVDATTPATLFDNVQIGVRFRMGNLGTKPTTGRISGNIDGIPLHPSAPDNGQVNNLMGVMYGTLYTTGQKLPSGQHNVHLVYERATGTLVIPYPFPHTVITYEVVATGDQTINIVATPSECDSLPHGTVLIEQKRLHWDQVIVASGDGFFGPGIPTVTPYLWTVYFKADGSTLSLDAGGSLQGHATIFTNSGSHGNLGVSSMQVGSSVDIPARIGVWSSDLRPIPVDPALWTVLGVKELPGFYGAVSVIMAEGGHITEQGAEAGHTALDNYVQTALDNVIAGIGPGHRMVTQADLDSVTAGAEDKIAQAVQDAQSVWENLWSLTGKDATAGHLIWNLNRGDFPGTTLSMPLANNTVNDKLGVWGIDGASVICP